MNEESRPRNHPVVVGVDGSPNSWRAVLAAAWEARARGVPLALVHGYFERYPYASYGWAPYIPVEPDAVDYVQVLLDQVSDRVARAMPGVTVLTWPRPGGGPAALIGASVDASLVVVGARGHGGFGGLSVGSVAAQTAAYAHCPVMVVRPPAAVEEVGSEAAAWLEAADNALPHPGPVVVGVDGSPHADAAVAFAFDEASRRRVGLVAMFVWWMLPEANLGPVRPGRYDSMAAEEEAERMLAEAVAGWGPKFPDTPVEQRITHSMNPSVALIEASSDAGLVVVGSRGRGGFAGLLLGSVGRDLVGHAQSPVAVVHDQSARGPQPGQRS